MNATTLLTAADRIVMTLWEAFSKDVPEAPADAKCKCGESTWTMYEFGYGRSTSITHTDHWHAYTDGWDDMTEDGHFGLLICSNCDAAYQVPDIEGYD